MEENEETWDDYVEGTLFTINTNESTTTKYSPFFLMFGRNPRLPFEVEKLEQPITDSETLSQVMQDLSSEETIKERLEEMSRLRDTLFPRVYENIKQAQEKQKQQFKRRRGQPVFPFKVGDVVLQRNMLQMTKAGYKYEDQWLGPYKIAYINADKGNCRLENGSGKKLAKQVSIKHIKPYRLPCGNGSACASSHSQSSSMPNAQTPPVPKPRTKFPFRTPPVPKPRNHTPVRSPPKAKPETKPRSNLANTVTSGGQSVGETLPSSHPSAFQQQQQTPSDTQPTPSTPSTTAPAPSTTSKKTKVTTHNTYKKILA